MLLPWLFAIDCFAESQKMKESTQLSVIMPVYNGAEYMRASIDSVLASRGVELELICVDDGSEDESAQIILEYAGRDARVRCCAVKHAGVSVARNEAMKLALGEYVTFVDSDDRVEPDYLAGLVSKARETGADCVVSGWTRVSGDDRQELPIVAREVAAKPHPVLQAMLPKNTWGSVYSRAVLERSGAEFPPGMNYGEDVVFNYCVQSHCNRIVRVTSVGYNYHAREASLSYAPQRSVADMLDGARYLLSYYRRNGEYRAQHREYMLHYLVHSLRRARSLGTHECAQQCTAWVADMIEEAGILPEDFASIRSKDARMLTAILEGKSGMGIDYYWRRLGRRVKGWLSGLFDRD